MEHTKKTIYKCFVGSKAHNLYIAPSMDAKFGTCDIDTMEFYVFDKTYYTGFAGYKNRQDTYDQKKDKYDNVGHELRKAMWLLAGCNPNLIITLFNDPKSYIELSVGGKMLLQEKELFLSADNVKKRFVGYAYSQLHRMTSGKYLGYMGDKRKKIVDEFGYDCYSDNTQFLTKYGWKYYDEIDNITKIATINPTTFKLEFQQPFDRIKKRFNGVLYEFENRYTKMQVTENHRMFVQPYSRDVINQSKYKWQFLKLSTIFSQYKTRFNILTSIQPKTKEYKISDDYLRLLGLYISDGTLRWRTNKKGKYCDSIRITQTNHGKDLFINTINNIQEYTFNHYIYNRTNNLIEHTWVLQDIEMANRVYKDCGYGCDNKRLPRYIFHLSQRQCNLLLMSLLLGDGTFTKTGYIYYTCNKDLAEDIQILAILAGYNANIYDYRSKHNMLQVYISKCIPKPFCMTFTPNCNKKRIRHNKEYKTIFGGKKINYNGDIVCFSVPNELLLTRCDNKIAIQGNTKNAKTLIQLLYEGIELLSTGYLTVYKEGELRELLLDIKTGKYNIDEIKEMSNELFSKLDTAYINTVLPKKVDIDKIDQLLQKILEIEVFLN